MPAGSLKLHLEAELNLPRVARAGDPSEVAGAEAGADAAPVGVVQEVEKLAAEHEMRPLPDRELLGDGGVPNGEAGTANHAVSGVAVEARWGRGESGGVEPTVQGLGAIGRNAGGVGARGLAAVGGRKPGRHRQAALQRKKAAELPASQSLAEDIAPRVKERQRIDVIAAEDVGAVE